MTKTTLDLIDELIERKFNDERSIRLYLGISSLGDTCLRKTWYGYRKVGSPQFDALSIKRFEDGYAGEIVQANRLRLLASISLVTEGEDGKQIRCSAIEGHLKGHCDGIIQGLVEDPENPYIWEHKQIDPKRLQEIIKLKEQYAEHEVLQKWNATYWAQATLYMYLLKIPRHYMTISTAGGRQQISLISYLDEKYAQTLLDNAQYIIYSDAPPQRISTNPSFYLCKMCDYRDVCHYFNEFTPNQHCRTCQFGSPSPFHDQWQCAYHHKDLPEDEQMKGCNEWQINPNIST